jgi:predicted acetyltransferase
MSLEYRTLTDRDELAAACRVFWRSMVGLPPLGSIDPVPGLEAGRFVGAFERGELVGCADSYTSWLTVPGGARVPHAAVTHVGVLPTHTRRGIVTELLVGQLADFQRHGEIVASLCPSEAVIYERFGYAVATTAASGRLIRNQARLREGAGPSGQIRLADQPDATELLAGIYETAAWTGSICRPPGWWLLHHLAQQAEPIKPYRAVHGDPGHEDGFVLYRPTEPDRWLGSHRRTVVVEDFVAHSAAAYLGLLRHLLCLDLVDVLEFATLPADDPLPVLLADARALRNVRLRDEAWLRLVDVAAALNARRYRPGGSVVIEVSDPILAANTGRYRLSGSGALRTTEPAGIEVGVAALAAAYLGGTTWWQLGLAGRATELLPGCLGIADELFGTHRLPYSGTTF